MKDFNYPITEHLKKGLAVTYNPRNVPFLVESIGAFPYENKLQAIKVFGRIDTSSLGALSFPYPQLFVFSDSILVCTQTKIYELVDNALVLKIENLPAGQTWSAVDFKTYIYLTNAMCVVEKNSQNGVYALNITLPFGMCVCNYNGQILLGSPNMPMPPPPLPPPTAIIGHLDFDGGYRIRITRSLTINYNVWEDIEIESENIDVYSTAIKYVGNNKLYFCYYRYKYNDPITGLVFAKSLDRGTTWTTQKISPPGHENQEYGSVMACPDEDTIFILTEDAYGSDIALTLYRSLDGGDTWTTHVIDGVTSDSNIEICALNKDKLFVVYNDYMCKKVMFARSTDGGDSWTTVEVYTGDDFVSYSEIQAISAIDANNIFITFCDYTVGNTNDISLAKSTNGGDTWSVSLIHSITENSGYMWKVSMAVTDLNHIFVAYWLYISPDWYVALAKTANGGSSWDTDIVIGKSEWQFDLIAKNSTELYISHGGYYLKRYGLLFSRSLDGGNTWETTVVDDNEYSGNSNSLEIVQYGLD